MIELKELTRTDGTKFSIPVFQLWNEKLNHLLCVIGIDFTIEGYDWDWSEGIEAMYVGKLLSPEANLLNEYFPVIKLFTIPEWDYKQYPNPEIVILKSQRRIIIDPATESLLKSSHLKIVQ